MRAARAASARETNHHTKYVKLIQSIRDTDATRIGFERSFHEPSTHAAKMGVVAEARKNPIRKIAEIPSVCGCVNL